MPEKAIRCNKCNKSFLTSTNPKKEKDLCGKCLHKSKAKVEREERIARGQRIEQGYLEGHTQHEREPYFRDTLGTAWGIRKKWIQKADIRALREKYENDTPPIAPIKKVTRRRSAPQNNDNI